MEDEHQYNRHLDTHSTADKSPGRLPELELCDPSDDSSSSGSLEDFDSPDDPSPLSSDGCSRIETSKMRLFVIKMGSHKRVQYFRMSFNCAKCSGEDDGELRKLRRRVKRRLNLAEPFQIFNSLGYPMQEDEMGFLSQEGPSLGRSVVLYVSSSLCKLINVPEDS